MAEPRGFVPIPRATAESVLAEFGRDAFALWILLQMRATYEPSPVSTAYGRITLAPGQVLISERRLAETLGKPQPTIHRLLQKLADAELIRRDSLVNHPTCRNRITTKNHPPTIVTLAISSLADTAREKVNHGPESSMNHPNGKVESVHRREEEEGLERELPADPNVERVRTLHQDIAPEEAAKWLTFHEGDTDYLTELLGEYVTAGKGFKYLRRVALDPTRRKPKATTPRGPRRIEAHVYSETPTLGPSVDDIRTLKFEAGQGEWTREDCSREDGQQYLRAIEAHIAEHGSLGSAPTLPEWLAQRRGAA